MKFHVYLAALAVAAGITLGGLKTAEGKLVFEDDLRNNNIEQTSPQAVAEPVASAAPEAKVEERKDLSRAEVMRRQRVREELKNEDMLTQKLEELRLRDEMKRTQTILGSGIEKDPAKDPVASTELKEERVGSAITAAPTGTQVAQVNPALNAPAAGALSGAQMVATASVSPESQEEASRVSVTLRGGTSSINNSLYDVSARFSGGVGVGVDVSDNIAFEGGYTYSQYSLGAGNTLYNPQAFNLQQLQLNDNVFDMAVKAYLTGPKSRVRPFLGGGVGYRLGYVNYDDRTQSYMKQINAYDSQDVQITAFTGMIETGLEFKVSKSISITGMFRYFNILSAKQSNPINPYAFMGQNGSSLAGGYYGYSGSQYGLAGGYAANGYSSYGYTNDARSRASDSLARENFYQLMAGISVAF